MVDTWNLGLEGSSLNLMKGVCKIPLSHICVCEREISVAQSGYFWMWDSPPVVSEGPAVQIQYSFPK